MQKHILVVSFLPPAPGTGTPIVLRRHLQRLEQNGWKISVAVPELHLQATDDIPDSWQIIPLASRRWWWAPIRSHIPISLSVRFPLWRTDCEQALGDQRPSAILAVLWDIYPLFATHLSKHWNIPLSVIIHDQEELWISKTKRRLVQQRSFKVLNQAKRIWPVSNELRESYRPSKAQKVTVLPPIPETFNQPFIGWTNRFQQNPVVAHAGSLHAFQIDNFCSLARSLQAVNGTLLIIAKGNNPTLQELLQTCPNVKHQEPFEQNRDAIQFLADNASCILVSYAFSLNQQPWAATSFPSKLVEFSQLGLPVLILAPSSTAIGRWAIEHHWLSYISQLDASQLLKVLTKLTLQETWTEMANQTQAVALTEFNANLIQAQFESELATV